jgi:hypothetical protein
MRYKYEGKHSEIEQVAFCGKNKQDEHPSDIIPKEHLGFKEELAASSIIQAASQHGHDGGTPNPGLPFPG